MSIRILEERVERRETASAEENPYWAIEEPGEVPPPGSGCVRRGLCCASSPGWFAPGEVEGAAKLLGMDPGEFVRTYLIVDSLEVDGHMVDVFAPVKVGRDKAPLMPPASRVDRLYRMFRSPCVFFVDNGCRIYESRPAECRQYLCSKPEEEHLSHEEVARMWLAEGRKG